MPYNLLLLPLRAGYFFIHYTHFTRFRALKLSSYRLLFESALWGLLFLVSSLFITRALLRIDALGGVIASWKELAPLPHSGTAVGALLLGIASTLLVNRLVGKERAARRSAKKHGGDLLTLLFEAQSKDRPVLITQSNKKVYVGWVTLSFNLDPELTELTILPMISGYRSSETLEIEYTTRYVHLYEMIEERRPGYGHLSSKSFQIVIPVSTIVSVAPYNPELTPDHFDYDFRRDGDEETTAGSHDERPARAGAALA